MPSVHNKGSLSVSKTPSISKVAVSDLYVDNGNKLEGCNSKSDEDILWLNKVMAVPELFNIFY